LGLHGATDLDGVDAVLLPSDSGPTRARKIMEKLRLSDDTEPPVPRNPSLAELVDKAVGHYDGKVDPAV
jgi:hypothetical protein